MKKIIVICLAFLIMLSVFACSKNKHNIPSKMSVLFYYQFKGEDYLTEQLQGYTPRQLADAWGEPDGILSGFSGDIWAINITHTIVVYYEGYDDNTIVNHVKVVVRQ